MLRLQACIKRLVNTALWYFSEAGLSGNSFLRKSNNEILYAFCTWLRERCDQHNIKSRVFLFERRFLLWCQMCPLPVCHSITYNLRQTHTTWHPALWSCCGTTSTWIMAGLGSGLIIHILIGSPRNCVMLPWFMLVPDHGTYSFVNILRHYDVIFKICFTSKLNTLRGIYRSCGLYLHLLKQSSIKSVFR